jgi:hypothetical protein
LIFVKQDIGTLPVEIFKLFGANGPEEDDPGDDHKQDGDGDQDKNYVHERYPGIHFWQASPMVTLFGQGASRYQLEMWPVSEAGQICTYLSDGLLIG